MKRRQRRRKERRARRDARKKENTYLGGSKDEERALYADARDQSKESSGRADGAFDETKAELDNARKAQNKAQGEYAVDRSQAKQDLGDQRRGIEDIYTKTGQGNSILDQGATGAIDTRNNALATGSLVGSTDSVLANRDAKVEQSILENQANAQAQQRFSTGQINKGAMGLAAGQGESGALALQSAMAGATGAAGGMAAQQNLALAQQNADMRYGATMSGADAQLAAAAQERANQLAVADANAGVLTQTAGLQAGNTINSALATQQARQAQTAAAQAQTGQAAQTNLTLQGQRANLATGNAQIANQGEATDKGYQSDILTAKFNAGQARNKEEGRSPLKKALMPFLILGN